MKRISREIARTMGANLKQMRRARGVSQEQLAEQVGTDKRYISAMENGRGIGKNMLDRLCEVLGVDEDAFTQGAEAAAGQSVESLPRITRMILDELATMPEYEQLRLLADMVETRCRKLEKEIGATPATQNG